MEEKLVRRRAENNSRTTPVDQGYAFSSATEAVDQHGAIVERLYAVEIKHFLRALFVYPFRGMHNKRHSSPALSEFAREIWLKRRRVRPAKISQYTNREPGTQ